MSYKMKQLSKDSGNQPEANKAGYYLTLAIREAPKDVYFLRAHPSSCGEGELRLKQKSILLKA